MLRSSLAISLALTAALTSGAWSRTARASGRVMAYTEQSSVIEAGGSELEPWLTFRAGRERYYSRLDGRLEFEHGLSDQLQLAFYWNFTSATRDVVSDPATDAVVRESESEFSSASTELKYKLTDPVADALGSALYLEVTLGPSEAELEGKLIADRMLGDVLLAANLTAEYELEFVRDREESEVEKELTLEPALAAAYFFKQNFTLGIELRAPITLQGEHESTTLFGGPVASWWDRGFWAALAVEPQLVALSGKTGDTQLDLDEHERLEVRLLTGFTL